MAILNFISDNKLKDHRVVLCLEELFLVHGVFRQLTNTTADSKLQLMWLTKVQQLDILFLVVITRVSAWPQVSVIETMAMYKNKTEG